MRPIHHHNDLMELLQCAKAAAVISAWSELGLFEALLDGAQPIDALEADPRALRTTLPLLRHIGLVQGDAERVELTPVAEGLLRDTRMLSGRELRTLKNLSKMADVMREGGPVKDDDGVPQVTTGGVRPDDLEATRRFMEYLYRASEDSAEETARWVAPHLPEGGAVVDLGGGHGRFARAFQARAFQARGFAATLWDLPLVVDLARERHGDALTYREGDFLASDADLGGPYDAAILSNIVHGQSDAENADLVARLADALNPGGWVVLRDMFLEEHRAHPASAAVFALTMLFHTQHGESYSVDDVRRWAEAAGLEPPVSVFTQRHALMMLRKPASGA